MRFIPRPLAVRQRQVNIYELLEALEATLEHREPIYTRKEPPLDSNLTFFYKTHILDVTSKVFLPGIYFIHKDEELLYIGQTCDLQMRLLAHLNKFGIENVYVSFFRMESREDRIIHENYLIVVNVPKHNLYPFCRAFNKSRMIENHFIL